MEDEDLVEFQCAYCTKFFKEKVVRLASGIVVQCTGCKKKNHIYVATYQEAWRQIMGKYKFPDLWDPEK